MNSRYITAEAQEDILRYLADWKTGRYGKKLTWAILVKAFGYSRQALSGNAEIKAVYDDAKNTLRDATTEIDALSNIAKDNRKMAKELADARNLIEGYEQKFLRWLYNAREHGLTAEMLNNPMPPSIKAELRRRQQREGD